MGSIKTMQAWKKSIKLPTMMMIGYPIAVLVYIFTTESFEKLTTTAHTHTHLDIYNGKF